MPPKKGEPILPAVPDVEDEVVLPDEVEPVPEPNFCFVLGHLTGHTFIVEDPPPPLAEGEEPPAEPAQPTTREFDPCALIVAKAKEPGDALLKNIIVIEREDLQVVATAEEKTLAAALRQRLEKEKAARLRRKHNNARQAAIAAFEAAKAAEDAGEVPPVPAVAEEEAPRADALVLLKDYPSCAEDLQEISAEGLCVDGLVNLWAALYMAGESLGDLPEPTPQAEGVEDGTVQDDVVPPERPVLAAEPPEIVRLFYDAIHAAPLNTDLVNCTVFTLPKSHQLAFAPAEIPLVDHVNNCLLEAAGAEASRRQKFSGWLQGAERIGSVPQLGEEEKRTEKRLYERMMGSVDPSHHDVPLFLHCLTEQVECNLGGKARQQEDEVALSNLNQYLGSSGMDCLSGSGTGPMMRPGSRGGQNIPDQTAPAFQGLAEQDSANVISELDRALCSHSLAGGGVVDNGESIISAVHRVLQNVSVPGVKRSGLPDNSLHSAAQREDLKTRIYPFAPNLPTSEFEQLLLLHSFEDLLNQAQPERKWRLDNRTFRERIPRELLVQTLQDALRCEPFVSTTYLPRHDCLLVALHHRALPGRVMWHSWKGDLAAPTDSDRWGNGLFTTPTYNDWAQVVGGSASGEYPQPARVFDGLDGRQFGYMKTVEKLATPAEGSVILVTKFDRGLNESFPFPSAAALQAVGVDSIPLGVVEAGSAADDAESVIMGPQAAAQAKILDAKAAAALRFAPAVRSTSQLARVTKDGLAFGLVHDATWNNRRLVEKQRRAEIAALAAGEATGEADDSAAGGGAVAELPFSGCDLGTFWLSFADGARCTVRMHHERADLFNDGGLGISGFAEEPLPVLGAMITYSMAGGSVIQVFSDGAVRFMWPLAVAGRDDGPALAPVSQLQDNPRLPAGSRPYFEPGCPEDIEIMRTITPFGTVVRKLLSGRVEVYHTDSTTSFRNPTSEDLQRQLSDLRLKHGPNGSSRVELLERFCKVYAERNAGAQITSAPSVKEKAAGLPGHWVVVKPSGKMFGRVCAPSQAASLAGASPMPSDGGPPGSADGATGEATQAPQPSLAEILEGVLKDDGVVEYAINTGVAVATQVDLQTKHKTRTNALGLLCSEDPDGVRNVCVHADGTRVTKVVRAGGHDIIISKEPMALVRCEMNDSPSGVGMRIFVECADGAQLDIVPQTLSPASGLLPLDKTVEDLDTLSTNAWVLLKRPDIGSIVSDGKGKVEVLVGDAAANVDYPPTQSRNAYVAHCAEGRLCLRDLEGQEFVLLGDQTLSVVGASPGPEPSSPRCHLPVVAYAIPGMEEAPPPAEALPPRLFVIYGTGDAEEVIAGSDAIQALQAADADPQATVVKGEVMASPLEGCRCHSIFLTKVLDGFAKLGAGASTDAPTLSLGSLGTGWSFSSLPVSPAQSPPPTVVKFRRLIEYPAFTEDTHQMFLGTLKQYREWEQAEIMKRRAIMAVEDKKKGGKADAKKGAKKDDKKGKKKGKGKLIEEEVVEVVEVVLPKFVEDLNLNPFDHAVEVLRLRSELLPEPTNKELLTKDLARLEIDTVVPRGFLEGFGDVTTLPSAAPEAATAPAVSAASTAPAGNAGRAPPLALPRATPQEALKQQETAQLPELQGLLTEDGYSRPPRSVAQRLEDGPTFSYFDSIMGIQFLDELDPDKRATSRKEKVARQPQAPKKRSPWNPLLLGESPENDAQDGQELQEQQSPEAQDDGQDQRVRMQAAQEGYPGAQAGGMQGEGDLMDSDQYNMQQQPRLPIVAEDADAPPGPHPDKKGNLWDIYGQPRVQRPVASHAYVMLNSDYLEVEGATDRRVRTSSIAHKKNAGKAPSVSTVRKTGQHALGTGTEIAAKEILGELGLTNPEEHWKLTSSMQGLGDSNSLVEVTPGICRFGPVRQGGVYRMAFYLRNLDVDVTRFNVGRLKSEFVSVSHQPGQIAPGMAAKIVVEIMAKQPGKVEQLVEVRVKAHVIRIPVTARILEAEEYDRLDAERLVLHGKSIGRHREKSDGGEKRAVEVVADENYCRKVLGQSYLPLPDLEDNTMR